MKLFSVVIPVYNGHDVIGRALDSIYSQGLSDDLFEVICVDDCSPTLDSYNAINTYLFQGVHPANLKVMRHDVNKRQGGARNTGVMHAIGRWILYLDADDYFVKDSLSYLAVEQEKYCDLDLIMFDYSLKTNKCAVVNTEHSIYAKSGLLSQEMSGMEFVKLYPIPWSPWCYAYRREFLIEKDIWFVENVSFEDTDYSIRSAVLAERIIFLPIEIYCYVCTDGSTTTIGNDTKKVEDMFKCSLRIEEIAKSCISMDERAADAIMNHYCFFQKNLLSRVLWRLPYKEIIRLLTCYPQQGNGTDFLTKLAFFSPCLYAMFSLIMRPFLLLALYLVKKICVKK